MTKQLDYKVGEIVEGTGLDGWWTGVITEVNNNKPSLIVYRGDLWRETWDDSKLPDDFAADDEIPESLIYRVKAKGPEFMEIDGDWGFDEPLPLSSLVNKI